jgi:8-oxo-dGTP pyrophosphatase MutT (NUDIX family)
MRYSTAALALIEEPGNPARCLVQWNDGWQAYSLVGGHQRLGESFRECVHREVAEELRLAEGTDFRVGLYPLARAAYRAFSRRAQEETEYRLELFAVELLGEAITRVSADPANRWVARREVAARRADDGRPISDQVRRLLDAADDADFDLFVSYARADNTAGQVTRLVEHIRQEHEEFAPLDPLGIFFDVWGIRDGHDWERRIHRGLSQSKVMLAILSPNYFQSEWCRREWQTFVDVEMSRTYPGEAIHSIYIALHPDFEPGKAAAADGWLRDLQQRQFVDARPWWPAGAEALERADVQRRLARLREAVCDRVAKARQIDRTPRNLRERNPNFVGRDDELRQLRHLLTLRQTAAITAIHGIGGIGKRALAREYAHRFRLEYPGGQFEIDLSRIRSADELRLAFIDLANNYLDARISPERMQTHLDQAFDEARAVFEARRQVLLILDNVDDARLVSKANRAKCLPSPEWVHVIVTSRLEPVLLGGIKPLPLDALSTADALDLIARSQPVPQVPIGAPPAKRPRCQTQMSRRSRLANGKRPCGSSIDWGATRWPWKSWPCIWESTVRSRLRIICKDSSARESGSNWPRREMIKACAPASSIRKR